MDWSSSVTFLLLFIIGLISSEPRMCRDQNALNERMDAVQKRVEDTVQQLEVGLADLLETIEAADWRPLVDENSDALPKQPQAMTASSSHAHAHLRKRGPM